MEVKKLQLNSCYSKIYLETQIQTTNNKTFKIKLFNNKEFEVKIINWNYSKKEIIFKIKNKLHKVKFSKNQNILNLLFLNASKDWKTNKFSLNQLSKSKSQKISKIEDLKFKPAIYSPLAGRITKCNVKQNQKVMKNQCLFIIESMKIENEIRAEIDSFIKTIPIKEGDLVQPNQVLITLEQKKV
jgi:biotin carboxyl carrier protein